MAPSRNYLHGLKLAVTVASFIFSLLVLILPPKSVHGLVLFASNNNENLQQRKMVLGSRPPGCVNKCLSCRPCMATLVVPSHQRQKGFTVKASSHGDDDSYYLLSWKCKCGNKLFQP